MLQERYILSNKNIYFNNKPCEKKTHKCMCCYNDRFYAAHCVRSLPIAAAFTVKLVKSHRALQGDTRANKDITLSLCIL